MYLLENVFYGELDLSGGDIGSGDSAITLESGDVGRLSKTPTASDPMIFTIWDKAYEHAGAARKAGGKWELFLGTGKDAGTDTLTAGTRGFSNSSAQSYNAADNTTYGIVLVSADEVFGQYQPLGSTDAHVEGFTGDLNNHLQGIVFADTGHTNSPNGNNGICRAYSLDDDNVIQRFEEIASNVEYWRRKSGGAWQSSPAWNRVGIAMADQWRLTTTFTGNAVPIASNLERVDTYSFSRIGDGMSQASGVFTFPEAGIYLIEAHADSALSGDDSSSDLLIQLTTNNGSNWNTAAYGRAFINQVATAETHTSAECSRVFSVTDVANDKVRFAVQKQNSSTATRGSTDINYTFFTFIKLGDV